MKRDRMLFLEGEIETSHRVVSSKVELALHKRPPVSKRSSHLLSRAIDTHQNKQQRPRQDIDPYKKMSSNHHHHHHHARHLSAALCSISLYTSLLLLPLISNFALGQIDFSNADASTLIDDQINNQPIVTTQEILVQPHSHVRIQCKIPQLTESETRQFQWLFQRNSLGSPASICSEKKCVLGKKLGIELYTDPETGAYDLMINNATYGLHDGSYHCGYEDSTPGSTPLSRGYRLTVLIPPQPPVISSSANRGHEGQEYQLSCQSQGGNPEPNITWFRNDQQIGPGSPLVGLRIEQTRQNGTTTNSLTWLPSMEDNNAEYKCSVWNKAMSTIPPLESEIRTQVEYAPRITLGPSNPLKVLQGSHVTIQCQVDAFPGVKSIRWFKDGNFISNAFNHTITDVKNSDSSIYTCQADNGIPPIAHHGQVLGPASSFLSLFGLSPSNQDPHTPDSPNAVRAQLRLEVLYPPRVQVRPTKSGPHLVEETLSLNCSVDSSPPPYEYVWTKQEDPSFKHSSGSSSYLEFTSLTANDMGNYTCTAFNRLEPSILPSYNNGLQIGHGSGSGLVQVRHRPGAAEIVLGINGETESSSQTQITCRSKPPGFPEPQYKFWKYSGSSNQRFYLTKQLSASTYTILSAKATDEGRYGCVAINEIGSSTDAEGDLIVNEVPVVIEDANRRDSDARAQGDSPYSITVRANGKPEPKVTWYHRSPIDGRTRIDLSSPEVQAKFKIETVSRAEPNHVKPRYNVVTTLTFKQPLEVDDRGLYSVEFNNGLSKSVTEDFQLHINHPPIPALRNQPILVSSSNQNSRKTKAGFDLGETVNLTCRASAYPRPDFYWHDQKDADKPIETSSRYRVSELRNPIDDVYESTLSFMLAQKDDYGDYTCAVANSDPNTSKYSDTVPIIISLTPKTVPDPPYSLEATDATQDSITIQWIPGFDGGFALNHYTVQYAPDDGTGLSINKRFLNADSVANPLASYQNQNNLDSIDQQPQQQNNYPRTYDCLNMNPCTINHLLPRQLYTFRVRAKNDRGSSEYSDELRAMTRANITQIPRILEASFGDNNILHFRIEPGSDYLLNSLNARIEYKVSPQSTVNLAGGIGQSQSQADNNQHNQLDSEQISATTSKWEQLTTVPLIQEKYDAHLNMSPGTTQLRITLCSKLNESICGPELVVDKSAMSSFLQAERGLSVSILISTLTLIVVLGAFATTIHSCCLSRKNKKADSIERVNNSSIDNKPIAANGSSQAIHKSSHGSTTSTNSTSAGNGTANGLQSMDSISNALNNAGAASDHSSDHSRQAKLDSMLPPNYNHYADRNSILLEQQQHQLLQQQGLITDKLSSPFGLPNSALLSVANQQQSQQQQQQQQQQNATMLSGGSLKYFSYNQAGQVELQQPMSLEHHTMMDGSHMMLGQSGQLDPEGNQQQQQQMWQPDSQLDDYNNYNTAALAFNYAAANHEMVDPTYGTTGSSMIMSQQSAAYDNTTNSGQQQHQYYLGTYQDSPQQQQYQQQQAQYQQEMAAVQQQMYGTLTRNGYSHSNNNSSADSKVSSQQNNISNQQLIEQQQYGTTNGLIQTPTSIAGSQPVGTQESDYGTTGVRSGRLIREIIV